MNWVKRLLLFLISLLIGIVLLTWIIKSVGWTPIREAFSVFKGWQGLVIIIVTLISVPVIGNWRWKYLLKGSGVKLSFKQLLRPYLAGFPFMFFFPMVLMSGELFRGYAIRKKYEVGWPKAMASIVLDRILDWTMGLIIAILGVLIFLHRVGLPPRNISLIFGGGLLGLTLGISFFYFKGFRGESILRFFGLNHGKAIEVEKEIFKLFKKKGLLFKIFSLSILIALFKLIRVWLLIIFLGKAIHFLSALSFLGFFFIAITLPVPAALGTHELVQTFAFENLGLGAGTATAFTMILRGADLITALIGIAALFSLGLEIMKITLFGKIRRWE